MNQYKCKACQWQGREDHLEYDDVESCMGSDKIEMCPKCGSLNVVIIHQPENEK